MTTGLTYRVVEGDGCTLEEFILRCARHVRPCFDQRDDDSDVPPRLPDRSDLRREYAEVERREMQLADAKAMTDEDALKEIQSNRAMLIEQNEKYAQSAARERGRLQAMLVQVRAWQPPTPNHDALKALMIQQLEDSYREIQAPPYDVPSGPDDPAAWRKEQIVMREERLADARRDLANAELHFETKTAWVTALYKSIGIDEPEAFFAAWQRTPAIAVVLHKLRGAQREAAR